MPNPSPINRWRRDPVAFIREVLIDPETGKPFEIYPAQERFLRESLTLTADGRLPYPEIVFGAPKKSGKTGLAAMITIYVVMALGGPFAEAYCVANDFEQAAGRVFQAIARIVEASPLLRGSAKITQNRIEFTSTGATITAIASDYASAAGANPTITVFDELWGVVSERGQRLFDEMVCPPTRKVAARLTVTYAGFEGESVLLENLYARGVKGTEIAPDLYAQKGLLMFWAHSPIAPWQTAEWIEQMRLQLRPNAFLRLIENRWVTSESGFVDAAWWAACVDPNARPVLTNASLPIWIGLDASVKRDSTAIVACTFDTAAKKIRLVMHRIFQPSPDDPLDFEETIEKTLLEMRGRFAIREIRFDPYQLVSVAQRLRGAGLPMVEFPQSVPNLTEASTNLYEAIKGANLIAYPDSDLDLAIHRAVAVETPRGWKISKATASHKIDVVVALGMAALGAIRGSGEPGIIGYYKSMAWPDQFPLPRPEPIKLEATPEFQRMKAAQAEPCAKCKFPLGASRVQITIDRAIHPVCPNPDGPVDSFGNAIPDGKPNVEERLIAGQTVLVQPRDTSRKFRQAVLSS